MMRGRGGFAGRGRGRGRGRAPGRSQVTREQLDNQLDAYMSKTKGHLDAELDAYMAQAEAEGMEWPDPTRHSSQSKARLQREQS